jgi:hypothetical protein
MGILAMGNLADGCSSPFRPVINANTETIEAGLNLTESQLSPPTMKILNKIPSIK